MRRQNAYRMIAGFTMIELLVAMLVGSLLATSIVAVFIHQTRAMALQEDFVDLEQNLRIGMNFLIRDTRMAGLYVKGTFAPFTIGPIDSNGDGTSDLVSEGGAGPDAIQLRLSPVPGLQITNYSGGGGGGAANLRSCAPSGLAVGQVLQISAAATGYQAIQVTQINEVSCPGDGCPANRCDKVNFSPGPSALNPPGGLDPAWTWSPGGNIWGRIETITYYVTQDADGNGVANDPALMRVVLLGAPVIVAFGINDLQVDYILNDGSVTTNPADANSIRRLRLALSGETRSAHAVAGGPATNRTRSMTTEVQVRNLFY